MFLIVILRHNGGGDVNFEFYKYRLSTDDEEKLQIQRTSVAFFIFKKNIKQCVNSLRNKGIWSIPIDGDSIIYYPEFFTAQELIKNLKSYKKIIFYLF